MSDQKELEAIQAQAQTNEATDTGTQTAGQQQQEQRQEQAAAAIVQNTAAEFAAFLDMAAKVAGQGLALPMIPMRFTPDANLEIARAAVDLCAFYGIDARAALIGGNSVVSKWLGLVIAIGMPGYALYRDIQLLKMKEVHETDDKASGQAGKTDDQQQSE